MWKASRKFGALVALALATFAGGVALGCDGNYCQPFDDTDCVVVDVTMQDSCCVQLGGTARRCATCTRDQYYCLDGEDFVEEWGPAYNCQNPGAACQ